MSFGSLAALEERVGELVAFDVSVFHGSDAGALLKRLAVIEAQLASVSCALSARAVEGNVHIAAGARDGATWLASTTGVSVGAARDKLATAARLSSLPEVAAAFSSGALSLDQAKQVANAAVVDPSAQAALVGAAAKSSLVGLKRTCREVIARGDSTEAEATNYERLRSKQYLRTWTSADGLVCGEFGLPPQEGAGLLTKLKPFVNVALKAARSEQRYEPHERYAADGLAALVDSAGGAIRPLKAEVVVVVDHEALIRGYAKEGERCEIEGVGSVPVAMAKAMANDCFLRAIILNQGKPTMAVGKGHYIPNRLRVAVRLRDRCCVVPGCDSTFRLEVDHIIPVAERGPTVLENLRLLCKTHHDLRTYRGWDVTVDDDGSRHWRQVKPRGSSSEFVAKREGALL